MDQPRRPHTAPVPPGLAEAAGFPVADTDPDLPLALAGLTPDQWLAALNKWVKKDPGRKTKTVAGPVWWWSLHSVAMNPSRQTTPLHFVGLWLGHFTCRVCRIETRKYIGKHPVPDWASFEQWASELHSYISSRKRP